MDAILPFATIMFVLSLVVERISNLIKLSFHNETLYLPFFNKSLKIGNLRDSGGKLAVKTSKTQSEEKKRELKILFINLVIGFFVAGFLNADIFQIIGSVTTKDFEGLNLGWQNSSLEFSNCGIWILGVLSLVAICSILVFFYKREQNKRALGWLVAAIVLLIIAPILSDGNFKIELLDKKVIELKDALFIGINIGLVFGTLILVLFSFYKQYLKVAKILLALEIFLIIIGVGFICINPSFKDFQITRNFFGFILTGCFLSLGSKFWHDLLDMLFTIKKAQSKLQDPRIFTDFGSADEIKRFATTSRYDIVTQLFSAYREDLRKIDGIASLGVVSKKGKGGLYQQTIEIEYKTTEAYEKIVQIVEKEFIEIERIEYYLEDYCIIEYTEDIVALSYSKSKIKKRIMTEAPVWYAKNSTDTDDKNLGSFGVYKNSSDGKFYAVSNLHVFASKNELKNKKIVHDKSVLLFNSATSKGMDCEVKYAGLDAYSDYAVAEVPEELHTIYRNLLNSWFDLDKFKDKILSFGATSKTIHFYETDTDRTVEVFNIKYGNFTQNMNLVKLESSGINISSGDSGSIVYQNSFDNPIGLIVAKSKKAAYMVKFNF